MNSKIEFLFVLFLSVCGLNTFGCSSLRIVAPGDVPPVGRVYVAEDIVAQCGQFRLAAQVRKNKTLIGKSIKVQADKGTLLNALAVLAAYKECNGYIEPIENYFKKSIVGDALLLYGLLHKWKAPDELVNFIGCWIYKQVDKSSGYYRNAFMACDWAHHMPAPPYMLKDIVSLASGNFDRPRLQKCGARITMRSGYDLKAFINNVGASDKKQLAQQYPRLMPLIVGLSMARDQS